MRFLKPWYLTNRFFLVWSVGVIFFGLGFIWPMFEFIGYGFFGVLFLILAYEVVVLSLEKKKVAGKRELTKILSLSDENPCLVSLQYSGSQNLDFTFVDELPVQFQIRDFQKKGSFPLGEDVKIEYPLRPVKRGLYEFGDLLVFLKTQIGLLERKIILPAKEKIPCYPSIIQMDLYELMVFSADRNQVGIKKIRKLGHGYEFSDIRQYVTGDDPRTINWKASGRSAQLMVNNYVEERSQQIYTVIDSSRVMRMPFNGLSLLDYSVNASLSLQNIVLRNQDHAGLITFAGKPGLFVPADRKADQRQRILDGLYNLQGSQEENNFRDLYKDIKVKLKSRSMLILMTHFMSLNAVHRIMGELKALNRDHLLTLVFFENTELSAFQKERVNHTLDVSAQVLAGKLQNELKQAVYELRQAGIQVIHTPPEKLTTQTINKYLEMKSRGFI